MNGTATCGERVVIVQVDSGHVNLTSGRISDVRADDSGTVTLSDGRTGRRSADQEETRELSYKADDIHLLKEQEARLLQDPTMAQIWFGAVYQDPVINRIQRALKRLKWA